MRRGLALAVALLGLIPGTASAAALDHVTMYSDGDYIGGGQQRYYTPANGQITVGGSTGDLTVQVSGGSLGDSYHLEFAAPPGETLQRGVYDRAQRAPFREAGRPGIDISGSGRGCNEVAGRFEVRDIAVSGTTLQRLWIVYEHHCEGGTAGLFGEVRLGEPGPAGPVATAPSIVRWPLADLGGAGAAVPVQVRSGAAATVGDVSVQGAGAGQFAIRLDECSGRSLPAGSGCEVWVRFTPTAPGTHTATLRIPEGGRTHDVALQGFAYGGSTRVHMVSDPGDYIGQGQTWDYTAGSASIAAGGNRSGVSFGLDGANGDWWYADFVPGQGDILVPGETHRATRYPFNGSGPGMSVDGEGRGCNTLTGTFTVTDLRLEPDGRLRAVGVDFEQHCEGAGPALRGSWEFRKGDDTPLPPWMVTGPSSTGPPTNLGGGEATGGTTAATRPPGSLAGAKAAPATPAAACAGAAQRRLPLRRGSAGGERIRGSRKAKRILAGGGRDRVRAGAGSDCIDGGAGDDRLYGQGGNDLLAGAAGRDLLDGGRGKDTLRGGAGADVLVGGAGPDRLRGEGGDDELAGGPDRDRLDCGAGSRDLARGVRAGERVRGCERVARTRR
jgi:hypothetical protein